MEPARRWTDACSYLINVHRLKWQAPHSYFSDEVSAASDLDECRFLLQVLFMFEVSLGCRNRVKCVQVAADTQRARPQKRDAGLW